MKCPKCGTKCYIVRTRKNDVIVESWYCSACLFDDKEGKYPVKESGVTISPDPTEVST